LGDLVWKHFDLIEKTARKCGLDPALVAEDGMRFLQIAEAKFDESRGTSFKAFAKEFLSREFRKIRERYTLKTEPIGLNTIPEKLENEGRQKDVFGRLILREVLSIRSTLSIEEYAILHDYFVENKTLEVIGQELGVTRWAVAKRLRTILKRVKRSV